MHCRKTEIEEETKKKLINNICEAKSTPTILLLSLQFFQQVEIDGSFDVAKIDIPVAVLR